MARRSQTGWAVTIGGIVATILIVVASIVGYWKYASYVPPFHPQLPPMPSPNGYVVASRAVARLEKIRRPPVSRTWLDGSPAELRAQLAVVRPILRQVRSTLRLGWQLTPSFGPDDDSFRACAGSFAAESILERDEGRYAAAMQSGLDAMELGAKISWGGGLSARYTGLACHAIGFDAARRTVFQLPAGAIPAALERVRRLRHNWSPMAVTLENRRVEKLWMDTEGFQDLAKKPIYAQLNSLRGAGLSLSDAVGFLLTPRRTILANEDRFYVQQIAESKKPARQRAPVPLPGDPWSSRWLDRITPAALEHWDGEGTHLALLEAALAVRMYDLEHGRYPLRLSEISKKWLPAVPTDLWDQPIAYRLKAGRPALYSLGPDGKGEGGQSVAIIELAADSRADLGRSRTSYLSRHSP